MRDLGMTFGFSKKRRRQQLQAKPFPAAWRSIINRNFPIFRRLPRADQIELLGHVQVFLAEKHFEGCGGLELTDEIRVTVAAQACLLLLHRKTDYYPQLTSILVYPRNAAPCRQHLGGRRRVPAWSYWTSPWVARSGLGRRQARRGQSLGRPQPCLTRIRASARLRRLRGRRRTCACDKG